MTGWTHEVEANLPGAAPDPADNRRGFHRRRERRLERSLGPRPPGAWFAEGGLEGGDEITNWLGRHLR